MKNANAYIYDICAKVEEPVIAYLTSLNQARQKICNPENTANSIQRTYAFCRLIYIAIRYMICQIYPG